MVFKSIFVIATLVVACYAAMKDRQAMVMGDTMYFYDKISPMSRDQAHLYCEEQGGELAKINNQTVYNFARLHIETGSYWIDGRDKIDEYRFELTYSCSFTGSLNFYGIPTEILPTSCLSLVRGRSAATSKLQAVNCNEERVPFCQYPMNGCDNEEPPPFTYVLP